MIGLRPLLRLEDKVAAEGRRLRDLGGPSMRWAALAVLIAAGMLHGAILLMPVMRTSPTIPPRSPLQDFPLVWRQAAAPAAPSLPLPLPMPITVPVPAPEQQPEALADRGSAPVAAPPDPAPRSNAAGSSRWLTTEPVPEPAPELALNSIPAEVEAIIPNPDAPSPSLELGPPSDGVPAAPPDAAPSLLARVSPVYPVAARSLRADGRVRLRLAIRPDGSVGGATVEECSRRGLGFEAAALDAVKRWRYEPAPLQSSPRRVVVTIHFQTQEGHP